MQNLTNEDRKANFLEDLKAGFDDKAKVNKEGIIKVNKEKLTINSTAHLVHLCDRYDFDFIIKRSGTGLVIIFYMLTNL